MNGNTWWLWCFANKTTCYYMLDVSRGSPVLEKFFTEAFDGVLVTDFWPAYNAFATERQCCLTHLLRELEKVDQASISAEWKAFARQLRRLVRDGAAADASNQGQREPIGMPDDGLQAHSVCPTELAKAQWQRVAAGGYTRREIRRWRTAR